MTDVHDSELSTQAALFQAEVPSPPRARYLSPAHPVLRGNDCRLLRDGVEAYPAMLEAIRGARAYIRLETYMFIDDAVGELFARALTEAAARGVEVTVLYDAFGSWSTRNTFWEALRTRGVDVRPFRPFSGFKRLGRLIRRDHRKLLIVDGTVAFVGGVNIASHWAPKGEGGGWRDDVLRIEGPGARALERRFGATWRMMVRRRLWGRHRTAQHALAAARGDVDLSVLSSRRSIHQAYVHAIDQARSTVLIAAGYFIPDRRVLAALKAAVARGVEVSLVLAGETDHPFVQYAGRAFYDRLLQWGVQIFEWHQGVLHAKTAVVDGCWGTVGSFNLERWSLRFHHEVNVVFADPRWGQALEDSFRRDCGLCQPVTRAFWSARPWWQRWTERVCYMFRKFL